ncbi:MAG: carbon-nitrogen hydrolase family protein [Armatimonadota bacterium]
MARYARLTTVSWSPGKEAEGAEQQESNRRQAGEMIDRAARDGSDLVCMPEIFAQRHLPRGEYPDRAEPIPGPTTDAVGEACRRNDCYSVACTLEERDGRVYNAAALIDRKGEVVGVYHKMRPTRGELDLGITPGSDAPAFETDFARVGFAICFDMNFPEVAQRLQENGARCVCWPSMYDAGRQLQFWAEEFGFYLMGSWGGQVNSIVDMTGRVLAQTGYQYPIASVDVNMDRECFHQDENRRHWDAIREKYGRGVSLNIPHPEGKFTLASEMDDVSIEDITEEFGLETWRDYRRDALDRILAATPAQ